MSFQLSHSPCVPKLPLKFIISPLLLLLHMGAWTHRHTHTLLWLYSIIHVCMCFKLTIQEYITYQNCHSWIKFYIRFSLSQHARTELTCSLESSVIWRMSWKQFEHFQRNRQSNHKYQTTKAIEKRMAITAQVKDRKLITSYKSHNTVQLSLE